MKRKEEITKKIEELEQELCAADKNYDYYANQVELYLEKKINLNEQINDLKEELQEIESENLIAPLNYAITAIQNYCKTIVVCDKCLLKDNCEKIPYDWNEIK